MLFEHPVIAGLAKKYGKTPAQVLLRWATQRGLAVIPKSNNPERLKQNLEVTGFDMEKAENTLEDDDKALANYIVPTLQKGVKTIRKKPAGPWLKFRIWYNPYRMVRPVPSLAT